MFRVGILDGNVLEQQQTRLTVQTWLGKRKIGNELFLYKKAEDVTDELDVLITDTKIGAESVLAEVKHFHKKNPLLPIVVVTNDDSEKERRTAQDLHCYAYLLKSEIKRNLSAVLDDAFAYAEVVRGFEHKGRVSFKTTRHYLSVPKEDILYFKFKDRKVKAVTTSQEYVVHHTLRELSEMVGDSFSFCHRSCLVNLEHVRMIFGVAVTMDNGEELVLSQKRGKSFRIALKEFAGKVGKPVTKKPRSKSVGKKK